VDLPEQEQAGGRRLIRGADALGGGIAHSGGRKGSALTHTSNARELFATANPSSGGSVNVIGYQV